MDGQVGKTGVHVINSEPYRATQLWTGIVEAFEHGMEVGRHWRQLKYYDDSFTALDAVNFLLRYLQRNPNFGLSVTRLQTVQLLQKLHKAKVFEDVRGAKYDGEGFTENTSRLYRFCRRTAGPRSPFSFCRALINVRTPGKPISPAEPAGHKKVNRTITFDDKENQMPQDDFRPKRRSIAEEYHAPMKQFNAKDDVPVKVMIREAALPLRQINQLKQTEPPALKENQSLFGALQLMQSPRIPVLSEYQNSIYVGRQMTRGQPLERGAQLSWKLPRGEETGTSSNCRAQQRRALTQVNTKPVEFITVRRQISTANRNSEEFPQIQALNFQTFRPNNVSSHYQAADEKRQITSGTVTVDDSVKCMKQSNFSNVKQQGTVPPINTGMRSALGLWKKSFARLISEDDLKQRCFAEFKVRLCVVLDVDDLNDFYVPAPGDHENIFCNLTCADGEDNSCDIDRQNSFPAWLHSAMRCLMNWLHEAVGSLPKYPGFERDVFQAVVNYFEDVNVEPIFRRLLSQALCKSLVHLNFRPEENASQARKEGTKEVDEACMETSFGLEANEPRTRLIHQPPLPRSSRVPRGPSCLAQPRVIASPLKNCSNPMSLVTSGLDLSQVPDNYVEYSGSSLSYLHSMPDVSFLDQSLFDMTAGTSRRSKKTPSYSAIQSQEDLSFGGNTDATHNHGCHHLMLSSCHLPFPSEDAFPAPLLNNTTQPITLEGDNVRRRQWDRSKSITHLHAHDSRCQCVVDNASTAGVRKSHSCAYLAQPSRRSCDLKSQPCLDNTSESFFLTRSTSRGAVTASYRLAVDKNESFSTPVGKSLFSSAANRRQATKRDHYEKFLGVLQMFSLLLPASTRRCLIALLRFLSRISSNEDLVLNERLSVRQMVQKHFAYAVFQVDDSSNEFLPDVLAFMVDHYEDVTRIPEALQFVAREFDERVQNSKAVNKPENGMGGKKDRTNATPKVAPTRIASSANLESATAKTQSSKKMSSMLKKPIQRLKSMRF